MSTQPEGDSGSTTGAGSESAAEADELQGYGNDTGFAAEAEEADQGVDAAEASATGDDA